MSNKKLGTLSHFEVINKKYTVQFFIKKGLKAETYRVKDNDDKTLILKLFQLSNLDENLFNSSGSLHEIELLKAIKHPNVVRYSDNGFWLKEDKRYAYLVTNFISGETLQERLRRDQTMDSFNVKRLIEGVLKGLKYLHQKQILLTNINHKNIMLDLSANIPIPKIIDFSYAYSFNDSSKEHTLNRSNPFYLAPEFFKNIHSYQSDLFSVGALIYHLLIGLPPWFIDVSDYSKDQNELVSAINEKRKKPLKAALFTTNNPEFERLIQVAKKALELDIEKRFLSATDMLEALNKDSKSLFKPKLTRSNKEEDTNKGFNAIAGMDELKEMLYQDVIRAIKEESLYEEYRVTKPNGILLYGPPGCGKSFFAQKLAEELEYNYVEIKPSTLASVYIHGSQEKISKLFDEARKNAPTILNFEEFDALVPKRDSHSSSHQSGEVNEFLAQLNNCGKDNILVIATTNQPTIIDTAVLRAGRIDKVVFIPPPDFKARKEMFKMFLDKRPLDSEINYDTLAEKTDNYVSIDISHLVNEAARYALKNKSKITQQILNETIASIKPSVNIHEIKKYDQIKAQLEGLWEDNQRPITGFNTN